MAVGVWTPGACWAAVGSVRRTRVWGMGGSVARRWLLMGMGMWGGGEVVVRGEGRDWR